MSKNPKRGQRIIKSARRRKREFFQTMTPKQRREYEDEKKRRKNGSYNYQFSRKENFVAALVAIGAFAVICGVAYFLYRGIKLVISLVG